VGQHSSASGSLLLDLDGLEVVSAEVVGGEWRLVVQTTATVVGCGSCGVRATPHGRRLVGVRDLPIGGRPVVLWWRKRLWRCGERACRVRTWTEQTAAIRPRAVLTQRARAEACRRVGKDAHAVAAVARDLGVGWATIMRAVADHGTPLVQDPARLDGVTALGLDETSFLKATRLAPTRYVTGLVDLERGRLLDLVADRTRAAVDGWLGGRPVTWLARIATVALDPWRGYASALVAPLGHATVVVDHFHAVRLANVVVDQGRRRTQQATLGHRGRKRDPLYHIRKLLLVAAEQLTERGRARLRAGLAAGDPSGEVATAWQGKELLRAVYAAAGMAAARAALDRFYRWADGVQVPELSRLAGTVRAWEAEILAWHATGGCSNGPTEAIDLLIKKVKRVGHGFRNFHNYRLRLLLHCGVTWQTFQTARLRGVVVHAPPSPSSCFSSSWASCSRSCVACCSTSRRRRCKLALSGCLGELGLGFGLGTSHPRCSQATICRTQLQTKHSVSG
jgi:transposase